MKQEARNSLEEEIVYQQEKLRSIYHKVDCSIDRFIDLYAQAERAIEYGQDDQQVITHLNKQLLTLKPIRTVREHFVHHYRKLSNLIRKIQQPSLKNGAVNSRNSRRATSEQPVSHNNSWQTDEKFSQFFKSFINKAEDYEMLDQLIVENYLRNGQWECAQVWPQLESKIDPERLFRESITARENIKKGQLEEAIKWCETERLYETHGYLLEYDLKLMHLLGLIQKGTPQTILEYYMNSFKKFYEEKRDEMEKLSLHIFFKINRFWDAQTVEDESFKHRIDERYRIFEYSQAKLNRLAQAFFEHYLRHYDLCKFNSLSIIYDCSQTIMEEYMRMMKLVWGGKQKHPDKKQATILPFSVKMSRENQYHSLFFCPITKEVHSSNESSKLLACGHLISDNAHHRISQQNRNRRKIKCPICQKQIRPEQSLKTQF